MKQRSNVMRFGWLLAPMLCAMSAQAAPRSVYFWNSAVGAEGSNASLNSARVGAWGNGEFADARDVPFEGAATLKITTRNFREGVRFDLITPLDISEYRESGYIRLRVHFHEVASAATMPGMSTEGGMPEGTPGYGTPGYGTPDYGGPQMRGNWQLGPLPPLGTMGPMPGMEGVLTVPTGPLPQETPISRLMCTLVLDNGVMEGTVEIPKSWDSPRQIDFERVRPDAGGWLLFTLPIKAMHSTPGASGRLRRMILSGDRQDSFWLTQAALVVETGAMEASIRQVSDPPGTQNAEITVRPGPLTLVADVEAGAADPAVEWNFDADNVGNLPPPNPDGLPSTMQPGMMPGGMTSDGMTPSGMPGMPGGMPGATLTEDMTVPLGPRIDARGLIAKFEYPNEEQNYRVEVTVRDRLGKKEPVTASILVKVRG